MHQLLICWRKAHICREYPIQGHIPRFHFFTPIFGTKKMIFGVKIVGFLYNLQKTKNKNVPSVQPVLTILSMCGQRHTPQEESL